MNKLGLFLIIAYGSMCIGKVAFVCAEDLTILTVEEPPSSFMSDEGTPAGFSVDIVREIQRRINNSDPIKILPEIRALNMASVSPNVVLFSFSRTKEREHAFHWIMLLMRKPWVMYSKKGAGLMINNVEDARKMKSIGVVRGDVRAIHLEQMGFSNLEKVSTHEQNVNKLFKNRIQIIFYEPEGMASVCRKLGVPLSDFEPVLKMEPSEVYILMSKHGTDPTTVKKWRDAAQMIKEDGTFQRIAEKWANIIYEQDKIACNVKDGALNF